MGLSSRVAVVTGGAGQLGTAVVQRLLREGAQVVVPVRHGSTTTGLQDGPVYLPADLSDEAQVGGLVKAVEARFSRIDILVNAAGGYRGGELLEDTPVQDWHDMIGTNLTTAFLMSRAVVRGMKARAFGRIITIAAAAGLAPAARRIPYSTAKAGVVALTRALAAETRGTGVSVTAIAPGTIDTPANRRSMPDADRSAWVAPDDIASVIVSLCMPFATPASGNIISMTGAS